MSLGGLLQEEGKGKGGAIKVSRRVGFRLRVLVLER